MDYRNLTDEMLYRIAKSMVPEIRISRVDDSNRNRVIAAMNVTEKIRKRRERQQIEKIMLHG